MSNRHANWAIATLMALTLASPTFAAQADPPPAPTAVGQQVQAIRRDFEKARADFSAEYRKASSDSQRQQLVRDKYPKPEGYAKRGFALAENNPSDPDAIGALALVLELAGSPGPELAKLRSQSLQMLANHDMDSSRLPDVFPYLRTLPSKAGEELLRTAADKSRHRDVRGQATLALAVYLKNQAKLAQQLHTQPQLRQMIEQQWGQDMVKALPEDADRLTAESKAVYQKVADEYADVKGPDGMLGDQAKTVLEAMGNLAVGKKAPEIRGRDIDDKPLKLSDYRGKVVVLDFWGDW